MEEDLTALSTKKNGLASLRILAHSYIELPNTLFISHPSVATKSEDGLWLSHMDYHFLKWEIGKDL